MKKVISIEGMKCENCVKHVKDALNTLENVKNVKVNLAKKEAIINGGVSDEILKDTVTKAGYEVKSITIKKGLF